MSDFESEEHRLLCHLYQVLHGDLKMCGCNQPEAGLRLVHDLLRLAPFHEDERWRQAQALVGSDGAFQLVISLMSEADLLEHGGTLSGSWLAHRGRWMLWAVEQLGGIDGLGERLEADAVGYPHRWDEECAPACWVLPNNWRPGDEQPAPKSEPPATVPVAVPCPGPSCARYLYGTRHEHTELQPCGGEQR